MPETPTHVFSAAVPRRYFGTDGVRGIVGEFVTPELVERLGRAPLEVGRLVIRGHRDGDEHGASLGMDPTRVSHPVGLVLL
jgi:phosphomannomutase